MSWAYASCAASNDYVMGGRLIYYSGKDKDRVVYDDRTLNAKKKDGCDVIGPSNLTNCDFKVKPPTGGKIPDRYLDYWVFNVEPSP